MSKLTGRKNTGVTTLDVLGYVFSLTTLVLLFPLSATAQVIFAIDDQLKDYWVIEKKVAPEYPERALSTGKAGCVAVGYIIQPDGSTSNHEALAHYPSKIFDKSGIKAAKRFTYTPSDQNPERIPVYTINSFTYTMSTGKKTDLGIHDKLDKVCTDAGRKIIESEAVGDVGSSSEKS